MTSPSTRKKDEKFLKHSCEDKTYNLPCNWAQIAFISHFSFTNFRIRELFLSEFFNSPIRDMKIFEKFVNDSWAFVWKEKHIISMFITETQYIASLQNEHRLSCIVERNFNYLNSSIRQFGTILSDALSIQVITFTNFRIRELLLS